MWPRFSNSRISTRKVGITSILYRFDQKNHFFERRSWLKFNNLGLTLAMAWTFYASTAKGLKGIFAFPFPQPPSSWIALSYQTWHASFEEKNWIFSDRSFWLGIKVHKSVYIASRTYQFFWQYAIILAWKTWLSALNQLNC